MMLALLSRLVCVRAGFSLCAAACAFPANDDVGEIAERVGEAYRTAQFLSFELVVAETLKRPDGELAPRCEEARATVAMGAGDRLRLIVTDPATQERVLERVCNGLIAVDWNDKGRTTVPLAEAGNAHVEADFDFCYVGGCLRSWLGDESRTAALLERRISQGKALDTSVVDGVPCYVVEYERALDTFLLRDTFYVDYRTYFLRQWTTVQADLSASGEIVAHITRERRYSRIRTDPVPAHTFTLPPEPQD
jgi:hypothetical protein